MTLSGTTNARSKTGRREAAEQAHVIGCAGNWSAAERTAALSVCWALSFTIVAEPATSFPVRRWTAGDNSGVAMPHILVLEDDALLAFTLGGELEERFALPVVIAPTVGRAARSLEQHEIVFALLDINLGNETSYDFARLLRTRRVPFVFTSGTNRSAVPDDLKQEAFVGKPCDVRLLEALIHSSLLGRNPLSDRERSVL